MNLLHKLVILTIACFSVNSLFAQKTLTLRVNQLTSTPGRDCDGWVNDSDWQWLFGGDANGCDVKNGTNSAQNWNPDRVIWGTNTYYSRECWPLSVNVVFKYQENDNFSDCDDENACSRSDNRATPVYNATNGNYALGTLTGVCRGDCPGDVTYGYHGQFEVGGTNFNAPNLDGNGYVANKTCATAIDIDGGVEATGTRLTNHANQCTEVWYTYDVTSTNLTSLTFDGANGTVTVYTGSCTGLCTIGSGSNAYTVSGPVPPGRYYIRISANGGRTNLNVSKTTGTNSNDYIAAATNLGTMPSTGGTLASNNDNFGSTQESGEPGLADSHTDWFYFTTGADIPSYVDIKVDGSYGSNDLDADFRLWKLNDNAYTFPRGCVNWGKLTNLGDGDGDDNAACRVNGTFESSLESYRRFCLAPNSKYYIQVAGWRNHDTWPCDLNEWEGNYRLTVVGSPTAAGKDNVCDAHDFGTLNPNSSTGDIYYNNTCLTTQAGEQRTSDMSNTMWYKFTTPSDGLTGVNILVEEAGEGANYTAATLYRKSGSCSGTSGLTEVAFERWCNANGGTFSAECLQGNTDYYLQVGTGYNFALCTDILNGGRSTGRYRVNISSYNATNGVDNVCSVGVSGETVGDLGTFANYTGSNLTITRSNHSNRCATTQSNEPSGGQKTTWYKFTTGNTVGRELYVKVDAKSNGMDAEVYVYEACNPPICSGTTLNAGEFNELANFWDGLLVPALGVGEWDAEGTLTGVIRPNTTYYLRVDGVDLYGGLTGEYDLIVRQQGGSFNGNDDICNAWTVGASNSPGGSGAAHTESISNNNILDLGETITVPSFNNKQASSQEQCALDEPNNDEDDETVWFKVTTGPNPGTEITIDVDAINDGVGGVTCVGGLSYAWVKAYKVTNPVTSPLPADCSGWTSNTNWFNRLSEAGKDDALDASKYYITCPQPNTTYYIQVENQGIGCDRSSFTMKVVDNGFTAGPDKICDAIDLGASPYGTPLSNSTNVDLFLDKQSNQCATVGSGEPDAFPLQSVDKSVWYKFTTPPAYYLGSDPLSQLPHLYSVEVNRLGGSVDAWPTFAVWEETTTTTRTCSPENSTNSFKNLVNVDYTQNLDFGDASVENLCLKPNTTYYIQVDHACAACIGTDYVEFSVRVKKSAFRPGNTICEATTVPTSGFTGINQTREITDPPLSQAPFFGLPHSNKCSSSDNGEPDVSPGAPGGTNTNYSASVWYKFTTDANPAEWIEWDHDDYTSGGGVRGTLCTGLLFNSKINIYKSNADVCIYPTLELQQEYDEPWEVPYVDQASTVDGIFRLRCPIPNTTYYVQVKDAGASPCFEGLYAPIIKTAPSTKGIPSNDDPCGSIFLGTVPAGGSLAPTTIFDNICATPTRGFVADPDPAHETKHDVWFSFVAPPSGSVTITAQAGPHATAQPDENIDLRIAVWDAIMGEANLTPNCADPRYLWTPLISRNHTVLDANDAGITVGGTFQPFDIYDTRSNTLFTEDNSLNATCLNPGKLYYIQVDGDDYLGCDLTHGGDCTMGYFKLQVKDAGLYDMASMYSDPGPPVIHAGNDEPCGAIALPINSASTGYGSLNWMQGSNLCATGINDPVPQGWFSTDATVWYSFIAPPSGKVKIRAENVAQINKRDKNNPNSPNPGLASSDPDYHESINLQLAVYTMANCLNKPSLVEHTQGSSGYDGVLVENNVLNSDDYIGVGTSGWDEYKVVKCLNPGQMYLIMLDGENDPTLGVPGLTNVKYVVGDYRISVQDYATVPASLNDNVCDAYDITAVQGLPINGSTQTGWFNNECATIQPNIEGAGKVAEKMSGIAFSVTAKRTLWFKFKAPSSGKVKIEAINSGADKIDLGMALYDFPGQNCNLASSGYQIQSDYDPGIATTLQDEEMTVECLIPGRYYYLQVDGANNPVSCIPGSLCETGEYKIKITHLNVGHPTVLDQGNDNMCDAINLGQVNPGNVKTRNNDNNYCSTGEMNEPDQPGWNFSLFDNQLRSVWYRFNTGPNILSIAPGKFTITVDDPSGTCMDLDIDLFEYQGIFLSYVCHNAEGINTQFDRLTKVGTGQPIITSPRSEKIEIDCPRPNTTYFLRVVGTSTCPGFGATQGTFDVKVQMDGLSIMSKGNDNICGANTGAGNMGTLGMGATLTKNNENNLCASQEPGEPNTSQGALQSEPEYDETMWYKFRTSASPGEVKVKIETILATGFASLPSVVVYKGSSADYNPCTSGFGGLIEVGSDVGTATLLGGITKQNPEVTLPCVSADWNYFVQVDGVDMALLGFTLPGFLYSDNFTYNVKVTDDGSGSSRPTNDNLLDALPVDNAAPINGNLTAGGSLTIDGFNNCATTEPDEPNVDHITSDHQDRNEDETVWYYFTTPAKPGVTTITVADDPAYPEVFSPNFSVYYNDGNTPTYARITSAPSSKLIREGVSSPGLGTSASVNLTCLLPNTRYYIQVDGNDAAYTIGRTDQGHFKITVTDDGSGNPGPSNDLICQATNLTSSLVHNGTYNLTNQTNKCSWEEEGEPNTSSNMGGTGDNVTANNYDETVWYKFQAPWDGKYTISLTNSTTGHNYVLYQGVSTYNCTTPNWNSLVQMSSSNGVTSGDYSCLSAGKWYYIQVDGNDGVGADVGTFDISVKHSDASVPSNDMVCSAWDLGTFTNGSTATFTAPDQNNFCATQELGEPNVNGDYYNMNSVGYDKTLWYRFKTPTQNGDWTINVTNQSPFSDRISGTFTLYQALGNACGAGQPIWSNLNDKISSGLANVTSGNNSLSIDCYKLAPNTTYFIQVQGEDLGIFGEVGTKFDVSVTYNPVTSISNDNVCNAKLLSFGGSPYLDNNVCASTQDGEPDLTPASPQDPFASGYDATMWYRFVAPAKGYVKIEGREQSSDHIDMNMVLYELPDGITSICTGSTPNWSLLNKIGEQDNPLNNNIDYENECLVPGRNYLIRIDGNDALYSNSRGDYTIQVIDRYAEIPVTCAPVLNDDPCDLPGIYDLSAWVREEPCSADNQYLTQQYQTSTSSPTLDCATRSNIGLSCGSLTNCNDYWFKFTVPLASEGGVRIQGNDEYSATPGINNSKQVIGAYRGDPCSGNLQYLGCDYGGTGRDASFDIAAIPGETIYLQVFNDNAPNAPSRPDFGLCISTRCVPKEVCTTTPNLAYDIPQCWNLDEDGSSVNDGGGLYGNCLPSGSNSANYFTFNTECGATADGQPDTVTVVFSGTKITSNTALAIYEDPTPCTQDGDEKVLINCVPFGPCIGCSPSTTFVQTYQLDECKTYVIQIVGQDDEEDGSSGSIYIFQSHFQPPVLPLELLTFTGFHDEERNILSWSTASEKDLDQFVVEKSKDGAHFEAIGTVGAYGNSTTQKDYIFVDPNPWSGDNFYRLKMIDFGETFEYSKVINVPVVSSVAQGNHTSILSVYPNPTENKTKVEMYIHESKADLEIRVTNDIGQVVYTEMQSFTQGNASFDIDAYRYAAGTYIISITNKSSLETYTTKFIKQ